MSDLISALDAALAGDGGQSFKLRRVIGTGTNVSNIDVDCRARIDRLSIQDVVAGVMADGYHVIFSPTQINEAQWPGGTVPPVPPLEIDQRVPRENGPDKAYIESKWRQVARVKAFWPNGILSRIEMWVTG